MSKSDEQFDRINSVFGLSEIPEVTGRNLGKYFEYLKERLVCPCLLTGIESMGYFSWEERFEFGYGNQREYQRLRKERGSYQENYELQTLADAKVKGDFDIFVIVRRVPDNKRFTIPLSELKAVDEASENYQLLHDYTVWYVNWR